CEVVADGGLDDPPTVATAVAAVDGGEALSCRVVVPAAGLTGDKVSVIGPGEFGFATGDPVDACQRPHPQVRVDRRSSQTLFGTDKAESCDDVAEVALGYGAAGAEQFFPEIVEPDRCSGRLEQGPYPGVAFDEGEQLARVLTEAFAHGYPFGSGFWRTVDHRLIAEGEDRRQRPQRCRLVGSVRSALDPLQGRGKIDGTDIGVRN